MGGVGGVAVSYVSMGGSNVSSPQPVGMGPIDAIGKILLVGDDLCLVLRYTHVHVLYVHFVLASYAVLFAFKIRGSKITYYEGLSSTTIP